MILYGIGLLQMLKNLNNINIISPKDLELHDFRGMGIVLSFAIDINYIKSK